jgi:hypothetical protein
MKGAILFLTAITLSTPDGRTLVVTPNQVTTVREPLSADGCWVIMRDSKLVKVIEPCAVVRSLLDSEPD